MLRFNHQQRSLPRLDPQDHRENVRQTGANVVLDVVEVETPSLEPNGQTLNGDGVGFHPKN